MIVTLEREYETVRNAVGAMWIDRDVMRVTGDDATSYLQGQLSQNIEALGEGGSAWSFLLQPHGKVDALVRVTRKAASEYIVDCDAGFGALVRQRLERFKMRTKVEIEQLEWQVLAIRGPKSSETKVEGDVVAAAMWPGVDGFDVLGASLEIPRDVELCSAEMYELLRIESGMPQMGREMDDKTIPAEAGINQLAIDFSKGCYTGQELVARIDARGNNIPRRLQSVVMRTINDHENLPPAGARIYAVRMRDGAKASGVLTSVAFSPRASAAVGLAMVKRELLAGSDALLEVDESHIPCRIEAAPLIP